MYFLTNGNFLRGSSLSHPAPSSICYMIHCCMFPGIVMVSTNIQNTKGKALSLCHFCHKLVDIMLDFCHSTNCAISRVAKLKHYNKRTNREFRVWTPYNIKARSSGIMLDFCHSTNRAISWVAKLEHYSNIIILEFFHLTNRAISWVEKLEHYNKRTNILEVSYASSLGVNQ